MRRYLLVGLVALGIAGCAGMDAGSSPPTVDVTGSWSGTWVFTNPGLGSGQIQLTLKQDGARVSGNSNISGTPVSRSGPVTAMISGNEMRILHPTSITGRLTVQGDRMTGLLDGLNPANINLTKAK